MCRFERTLSCSQDANYSGADMRKHTIPLVSSMDSAKEDAMEDYRLRYQQNTSTDLFIP
jgi:hypothetical protein